MYYFICAIAHFNNPNHYFMCVAQCFSLSSISIACLVKHHKKIETISSNPPPASNHRWQWCSIGIRGRPRELTCTSISPLRCGRGLHRGVFVADLLKDMNSQPRRASMGFFVEIEGFSFRGAWQSKHSCVWFPGLCSRDLLNTHYSRACKQVTSQQAPQWRTSVSCLQDLGVLLLGVFCLGGNLFASGCPRIWQTMS